MNSLTENIAQAISDFRDIKSAIINKGVAVPSGTPTADYSRLISQIGNTSAPIYGVSGLYKSDRLLMRTDDAAGLDFVINSSSGAIDSDFNSVFPWNETEIVTNDAGKFLKFPEMYFRVGVDSSYRLTDVAVSKQPHPEGDWYRVAPFMYGCYEGSVTNNKLKSVSGAAISTNGPQYSYRNYALSNGEGYQLLDLYHYNVIVFLWFIEFATKNSKSIMTGRVNGSGTIGGNDMCTTGGTDNLSTPSGFETAYAQMRYHYIEDFFGNASSWIEGIYCAPRGSNDKVTSDPSKYTNSSSDYEPLPWTVKYSGNISAIGWDSNHPFLCMPIETVSNSRYDTYFCDFFYSSDTASFNSLMMAVTPFTSTSYGMLRSDRYPYHSSAQGNGARLLKVTQEVSE